MARIAFSTCEDNDPHTWNHTSNQVLHILGFGVMAAIYMALNRETLFHDGITD